jgi:hypothetical protein
MASIIKANQLQDFGGNSIITSDGAGNLTTQKINYPAFEAYLSSNQSVSDNVETKVQFDTEVFDTNNAYDNSTNYRFTPTVAGKYFIYSSILNNSAANSNIVDAYSPIIKKNGVTVFEAENIMQTNYHRQAATYGMAILDLNDTDYVEIFGRINIVSGSANFEGNSTYARCTKFGAYRIGS